MAGGNRLVVVVDKQPVGLFRRVVAVAGSKVVLETGDDLLERLFFDRAGGARRIEMGLVDTLGEKAGETPARDGSRDIVERAATLFKGEVLVGDGLFVEALAALVLAMSAASGETAQRRGPFDRSEVAASAVVEVPETWNGGLLGVVAQHPSRVNLGVFEIVACEAVGYLPVGSAPVPDRYRERSEDEVRGLRRRGAGGT